MVMSVARTAEPRLRVFEEPSTKTSPRSCFAEVLSVHVFETDPANVVVALPFVQNPLAPIVRFPSKDIA